MSFEQHLACVRDCLAMSKLMNSLTQVRVREVCADEHAKEIFLLAMCAEEHWRKVFHKPIGGKFQFRPISCFDCHLKEQRLMEKTVTCKRLQHTNQ